MKQKTMIFKFDSEDEKLMKEVMKKGVINNIDVSNKTKILKLALKLASK